MKLKEIYKITFSGIYATATPKAELEPHPHLVKLNQVGKDISNFSGYWYFHVWVEAKSKKAAIRKGAVQIMEWLGTEGCKVISALTRGTMEKLLEQKAAWEVLKAEEEAKSDTAPEESAPYGDLQPDASSDVSPEEEEENSDEADSHNRTEVCTGWKVSVSSEGYMDFKAYSNSDYVFPYPMRLYEVSRTDECPVDYEKQFEIDRESGPSDFTLNVYVTDKEMVSTARLKEPFKEAAVRAAFIKLKWKLKDLTRQMSSSIAEKGEWSTYKFKVGDTVYLEDTGKQYTTYFSLFGDMVARAYEDSWNSEDDAFSPPVKQGKTFALTRGSGVNHCAKFVVRAREEVWEPTLDKFANIYLVQLEGTSGPNEFRRGHEAGDLHLVGEEGLSSEAVSIQI